MPRQPNYGFDKRRKEQDRKARKDAKKLDRQQRREQESADKDPASPIDEGDASTSPLPPAEEL